MNTQPNPDDHINRLPDLRDTPLHDPELEWDSDEALQNLKMERTVNPNESSEAMTRRLFEEAGPVAAQGIIHLATHSPSDTTRLRACTYVIDRLLGKPGQDNEYEGSPVEKALAAMQQAVTEAAEAETRRAASGGTE